MHIISIQNNTGAAITHTFRYRPDMLADIWPHPVVPAFQNKFEYSISLILLGTAVAHITALASCLIYAWALLEYVNLIVWVRSANMLPSMKFAEYKVLTFLILHEICKNSEILSLT